MTLKPSGDLTSITREEYMRLREKEAKQPRRKRAIRKSTSYNSWGSE